jgi:NADPH:quinone reductase-like Zn-dependent oxidoreductase
MDELTTKENRMRAIVTDPGSDSRFTVTECPVPVPAPNQALVRVTAFSLNQGEVRTAIAATTSYIPGWDFAGVIIKAASNGNSPKEGTRVLVLFHREPGLNTLLLPGDKWPQYPMLLVMLRLLHCQ